MARALFLLLIVPMAAAAPAHGQSGGIQVAPVMVAMSSERTIASLRVRNGRARPTAFEVDVYEWRQRNGEDVLTPSRDLIIAPGVFEMEASGEQIVRLGVIAPDAQNERAFRIILRELPSERQGSGLGFSLEMSLPVFVTPVGAQPLMETQLEARSWGQALVLRNVGRAHTQITGLDDMDLGALPAPRYLLAGASVEIPLAPEARTVRLRAAEAAGAQTERIVHVGRQDQRASLR